MAQTLIYNTTVEEVTPITLPTFDDDVDNVQQLDDEPNDVGGLTAQQLKEVFDKTGADIAAFLNNDLIPAVVADDATEQARQLAEGERVANEQERVSNENARVLAETGRVSAENARNVWEPYDNDKAYVVNNKVSYNGSSYVCKANTTGHDPTNATYWEMIAAKGADGILSSDTQTALNGVLFGNGATVEAKALDASGGAASSANMNKAFADMAPVEASTTAANAYAQGDLLILSGQLYKATAAIFVGDTLTVGTNIAVTTVVGAKQNKITAATVTISATWAGAGPYTQTVSVTGATSNSKIDLQPTAAQIQQLIDDGVSALYIENNAGTLTAYAVGAPTSVSLTIQCTLTEVSA